VPPISVADAHQGALSTHEVRSRRTRVNSPAERRQTAAEARREYIRRLVMAAPPVTAEQAAEVRRLLDATTAVERPLPQASAA
jgi:hypothetical protein